MPKPACNVVHTGGGQASAEAESRQKTLPHYAPPDHTRLHSTTRHVRNAERKKKKMRERENYAPLASAALRRPARQIQRIPVPHPPRYATPRRALNPHFTGVPSRRSNTQHARVNIELMAHLEPSLPSRTPSSSLRLPPSHCPFHPSNQPTNLPVYLPTYLTQPSKPTWSRCTPSSPAQPPQPALHTSPSTGPLTSTRA